MARTLFQILMGVEGVGLQLDHGHGDVGAVVRHALVVGQQVVEHEPQVQRARCRSAGRSTWWDFISSHRPSMISSSGSTRGGLAGDRFPQRRPRRWTISPGRRTLSRPAHDRPQGRIADPLSCISLAASEIFSAWSEIRSKSEMVCRYLLTSSLWDWDRDLLVIFIR